SVVAGDPSLRLKGGYAQDDAIAERRCHQKLKLTHYPGNVCLEEGGSEMNYECLAELSGVSKRYGSVVALDGMDLQVRPGELLSVLGPNGAGKSTAISVLLGLQ